MESNRLDQFLRVFVQGFIAKMSVKTSGWEGFVEEWVLFICGYEFYDWRSAMKIKRSTYT